MFKYSTKNSFNRFDRDLNGDDKIISKMEPFREFWALEHRLFFYLFCLGDIISNYEHAAVSTGHVPHCLLANQTW